MRKVEAIEASKEILEEIQAAFAAVAEPRAGTPTNCNRFSVFPSQHGNILVIGGAYAAQDLEGKHIVGASVAASLLFAKNMAEDIICHLRVAHDITDEDMAAAKKRNAALYDESEQKK